MAEEELPCKGTQRARDEFYAVLSSAALSPHGSIPQELTELELALLLTPAPLELLNTSLKLGSHSISHLVGFSNTKSYCLRRNPCPGKVALLLEHSVGLPRVLLLCWQVQVCLQQPLSLDRDTDRIFFFVLSCLITVLKLFTVSPWQGHDLRVPLAIFLTGAISQASGLKS